MPLNFQSRLGAAYDAARWHHHSGAAHPPHDHARWQPGNGVPICVLSERSADWRLGGVGTQHDDQPCGA